MSSFKLEQHQLEGKKTLVTLDGDLAGEYVNIVESILQGLLPRKKKLILHLRNLRSITPAGLELLRRLLDQGVVLRGAGLNAEHHIEKRMTKETVR